MPSGLQETECTQSVCPRRVSVSCHVVVSHIDDCEIEHGCLQAGAETNGCALPPASGTIQSMIRISFDGVRMIPIAILVVLLYPGSAASGADIRVDFGRDVRRLLSDKCFACHGPDERARKADLRFDFREGAEHVLSGSTPEIIRRITSTDPGECMPPPESKLSLTRAEIDILERWVRRGAAYTRHWSFVTPGDVAVPAVERTDWPRNQIDRFILARLEGEGLSPSVEASRERLIRRVSFDLVGLPPTIEEIDGFLSDTSANAYEKLVDDLLGRSDYGERMAAAWLDVARYSDTYGYQVDKDRYVWPWRDWIIRAFNANQPWDEFITRQLAGDLIPGADDDDILATTFNRLHAQKTEGGSIPEEFRVEYVADRNHTFATAFLGLALECARCHEHKYDPITQHEYYQLFAFFNSIDECGLYPYRPLAVPSPSLLLIDDTSRAKIDRLRARVAAAETALAAVPRTRRAAFAAWLGARPTEPAVPGRIAHLDFEDYNGPHRVVPGTSGSAVELNGDEEIKLELGNFARSQPFSVALWMNSPDLKERAVIFHRSRGWTDAGSRGYQLLMEDGALSASLIHFWPGNGMRIRTREPISADRWIHVAMTYDGSSRADGLGIFIDGRRAPCEVVRDNLFKHIADGDVVQYVRIGARKRDKGFVNGLVDEFKVFQRELTPIEVAQLHDGRSLADALATPVAALTAARRASLTDYYFAAHDDEYSRWLAALAAVRKEYCESFDELDEIMVMRELPEPRPTHLLVRGAYNAPAERVFPDTPAALPPFPDGQPPNRLGLARWLTAPDHPLTARVAVNRFWQMCFGEGLVRTPEDFGFQGKPPTHPALLDWLARDFIDSGWNVKRLLRKIVTSATYRQSSAASPDLRHHDPANRLYARGPSYRLPAEMIRDNALAVSGLLVRKIGGPPAIPYEITDSFKPRERDKGEGLYRKSLYTFWRRTAPAPAMMALDASKRDVCRVKRERTSTPLQAFVMLNGPQFVEAARVLGEKLATKHSDVDALIEELFRIATSRRPTSKEQAILRKLHAEQLAWFEADTSWAEKFLSTGDAPRLPGGAAPARAAAAGMVANALLNLDACVVKR